MTGIRVGEKVKYTYRDYLSFPDDGYTYQIIDGEVFMSPAPSPHHQRVLKRIGRALDEFVESNGLGEVFYAPCDVVLSEENVVQPDIFFISSERLHVIEESCVRGAPDLVVEILSPSSRELDEVHKKELYERFGVKEYWVVDPEKEVVVVWTLSGRGFKLHGRFGVGQTLSSPLLKGLTVEIEGIFRSAPRP